MYGGFSYSGPCQIPTHSDMVPTHSDTIPTHSDRFRLTRTDSDSLGHDFDSLGNEFFIGILISLGGFSSSNMGDYYVTWGIIK